MWYRGLDVHAQGCEPGIVDHEADPQLPRPHTWIRNRPSAAVVAGRGQAGRPYGCSTRNRGLLSLVVLVGSSTTARSCVSYRDLDAPHGPALHVEEPAPDDLLGAERDIRSRAARRRGRDRSSRALVAAARSATAPKPRCRADEAWGASIRKLA